MTMPRFLVVTRVWEPVRTRKLMFGLGLPFELTYPSMYVVSSRPTNLPQLDGTTSLASSPVGLSPLLTLSS